MNQYTVVLAVPDYIADNFGQDTYIASISNVDDPHEAVRLAKQEAATHWEDDGYDVDDPEDFSLLVSFEGLPSTSLHGFQYRG